MEFLLNNILPSIKAALDEDIGTGDVTTESTVPEQMQLEGRIIAREPGVIAGLTVADRVFKIIDSQTNFKPEFEDGDWIQKNTVVGLIIGPGWAILKGERVALNFLQRMSGIATLTRKFVDTVKDTHAVILDTRKTAPGLRLTDKWAVKLGGGQNHRIGLFDMALIKENHITAAGSITGAVGLVRANQGHTLAVEVEVKTLDELKEALALPVNRILLDNMSPEEMREAVQVTQGRIPLEASGNVNLQNAAQIAATGVDYISIGMLTHSAKALDISLLIAG